MKADWEQDFTEVGRIWGFSGKLLVSVFSQLLKNVFFYLDTVWHWKKCGVSNICVFSYSSVSSLIISVIHLGNIISYLVSLTIAKAIFVHG